MRLRTLWFAGLCVVSAENVQAQSAIIRGIVSDPGGSPIRNASIVVSSHTATVGTDENGEFTVSGLGPLQGEIEILVKRLGYAPAKLRVGTAAILDWIRVTLTPYPTPLPLVHVRERATFLRPGLAEFQERRDRGIGKHLTREQFLVGGASSPTDALRRTPGVRVVNGPSGRGIRFQSAAGVRDCMPLVWLDGQAVPGMEVDQIAIGDIEAMELYSGPSSIPMEFSPPSSMTSCGAVVVWTRAPGVR